MLATNDYGIMSRDPVFSPGWRTCAPPKNTNWWEAYSPKLSRVIRLYGHLTYYLWLSIETSPRWTTFCEHPAFPTPDGKVKLLEPYVLWAKDRSGQSVFFRTKYTSKVSEETGEGEGALLNEVALNAAFAVAPDRLLVARPVELSNWVLIVRFASSCRHLDTADLEKKILRAVLLKGSATIAELEAECAPDSPETVRSTVFRLIYLRQLKTELNLGSLNRTMRVYYHETSNI